MNELEVVFIAAIFASGIWLLLSRRWLSMVIGISMLGNGVNLFILRSSGKNNEVLPQALILTAIVIGFAVVTLLLIFSYLAYRTNAVVDTDELREVE